MELQYKRSWIPICKYDTNGRILEVYASLTHALKSGYRKSGLSKAINGKLRTYHNYQWRRLTDVEKHKYLGIEV